MSVLAGDLVDRAFVILKNYKIKYMCILMLLCLNAISPTIASEEDVSTFERSEIPVWHDCEGSSWHEVSDPDHKNVQRSGPIDCTGVSRICTNVTGPAKISFWWKSEVANKMVGQLSFIVDNTVYLCDSTGWVPISYSIWDNETHVLTWEFRKIRCYPKNTGAGLIGDVFIEYGEAAIPHGFRSQLSENSTSYSNGTIIPASITIISPEVKISPTNVSMEATEVKILPTNISLDIYDINISASNVLISNKTSNSAEIPPPRKLSPIITVTNNESISDTNYTTTIKNALENVEDNGTIYIEKGVYNEDIIINRPVKLIGLNYPEIKPDSGPHCTSQTGSHLTVLSIINSSDVWIEGFEICEFQSNKSLHKRGIHVNGDCDNVTIINNRIHGSNGNDLINGIEIEKCRNVTIFNNTIYNLLRSGGDGSAIYLHSCSGNLNISKNHIKGRDDKNADIIGIGINIDECYDIENITIFNNTLANLNIAISLKELWSFENYSITENNIKSVNHCVHTKGDELEFDVSKFKEENYIDPLLTEEIQLYYHEPRR